MMSNEFCLNCNQTADKWADLKNIYHFSQYLILLLWSKQLTTYITFKLEQEEQVKNNIPVTNQKFDNLAANHYFVSLTTDLGIYILIFYLFLTEVVFSHYVIRVKTEIPITLVYTNQGGSKCWQCTCTTEIFVLEGLEGTFLGPLILHQK